MVWQSVKILTIFTRQAPWSRLHRPELKLFAVSEKVQGTGMYRPHSSWSQDLCFRRTRFMQAGDELHLMLRQRNRSGRKNDIHTVVSMVCMYSTGRGAPSTRVHLARVDQYLDSPMPSCKSSCKMTATTC